MGLNVSTVIPNTTEDLANNAAIDKKEVNVATDNNLINIPGQPRNLWRLFSAQSGRKDVLEFNINPKTAEFNFTGRGSITNTSKGRIIDRVLANRTTGYMDLNLVVTMQTGNLKTSNNTLSLGHKTLFKIFEFINADIYTTRDRLNYQTIELNSLTFGDMHLHGFIDPNINYSENADDPFLQEYQLTFNVLESFPSILNANSYMQSAFKLN